MKFDSFKDNTKLIQHLKNGDENAFRYLVTTYHKPLFIYALSLINGNDNAEDIVQNVFLKTWEYRMRLNPDYSIKSFLYKTTYNEFINQYHKAKAVSMLQRTFIEGLDEAVDKNNTELLKRKIALIDEVINVLPNKCKETFLLSKKKGLTNIEIAEYMNVSIKTVEGQLTKAYKILRKKLTAKMKTIFFILFGFKLKADNLNLK